VTYRIKTGLLELLGPVFDLESEAFAYAAGARDMAGEPDEALAVDGWSLWLGGGQPGAFRPPAEFAARRSAWASGDRAG
jgi:hypothetical protein